MNVRKLTLIFGTDYLNTRMEPCYLDILRPWVMVTLARPLTPIQFI